MKVSPSNSSLARAGQAFQPAGSPDFPVRCLSAEATRFPGQLESCPNRQAGKPALHRQRGIALVVTLILLSVVTFLAVAFLFLARRERGAVATTVDLTAARRATDAANEHARARIIASIISSNQFYYGMIVSTNLIKQDGFVPNSGSLTNVNYDYRTDGAPLDQADFLQNVANLFYSPRPPVFVRTNRALPAPPLDFRFYHDLNHSGRFDTNGLLPEILNNGVFLTTYDTNGNKVAVSNFYVGDPEWVGVLERPDRPHSASNKFVMRWCFIVVPSGKTLDINTAHNQSKFPAPTDDGFSRNMGVGLWELNLASFLVDLNTNVWQFNPGGPGDLSAGTPAFINPAPYIYDTTLALSSQGTAFEDALAITRYRYGGDWNNLKSVLGLFGTAGETAFGMDGADGYGSGPLLLTNTTLTLDGDTPARVRLGWPGAENLNHFFTTQDLLDRTKITGAGQKQPRSFVDRLLNASRYGVGQYDRYTYYRLLSQLGTDSPPDPTLTNKIHLNYVNLDNTGKVVPDMQTNFISWNDPLLFFTNSVDRLLRATFTDTNDNQLNFGIATNLSLANIPVLVSNKFVYTPSVHRVLQVAANIWDASGNKTAALGADFPSVFRPIFERRTNSFVNGITDIYISGFVEVTAPLNPVAFINDPLFTPLDLNDPTDRAKAGSPGNENRDIYGVPWVIGAKKGFPNFNEFAMQSIAQISRELQLRKPLGGKVNATNQLFMLSVSNLFAFEAWNSYRSNYSRGVKIALANDMLLHFTYTNDVRFDARGGSGGMRLTLRADTNVSANAWRGHNDQLTDQTIAARSFVVPLQTNIIYLSNSIFRTESTPSFPTNRNQGVNLFRGFEQTGRFPIPQFTFAVSNRIRFIMTDETTGRVIDYVQLNDLNGVRNLSQEVTENAGTAIIANGQTELMFWQTNRQVVPVGSRPARIEDPPMGVINQIQVSLGNINVSDWKSVGNGPAAGATKDKEIAGFKVFMGLTAGTAANPDTNTVVQAPFTPVRKTSQYVTWQANDPLVHYTAGDLATLNLGGVQREQPNGPLQAVLNIRALNDRYEPWPTPGQVPPPSASGVNSWSLEAKDPGVTGSDAWDFPTNKFATLGLIGRVHRGTPWQTVYLKANPIDDDQWKKWTGNSNRIDRAYSKPQVDRAILDVFTTAIDQNSTRGQFNINQTGLAAMSALLGGVIGLTNASTDAELNAYPPQVRLESLKIDPAGTDPSGSTNSVLGKIYAGVNRVRAAAPYNGSFKHLGDILAVPELTTASPVLSTNTQVQLRVGINDAVYERLPQQLLGLMRGGDQPSFTIYAYGQALHPANRSIVTSGPYFGMCTNYQITAEFATRTEVEVQNAPTAPKVVIKSYNILPPE